MDGFVKYGKKFRADVAMIDVVNEQVKHDMLGSLKRDILNQDVDDDKLHGALMLAHVHSSHQRGAIKARRKMAPACFVVNLSLPSTVYLDYRAKTSCSEARRLQYIDQRWPTRSATKMHHGCKNLHACNPRSSHMCHMCDLK